MKTKSKLTPHEFAMATLLDEVMSEIVVGAENAVEDRVEDWKIYDEFLKAGRESIARAIYNEVMVRCGTGKYATYGSHAHARFAGSEFLKARINRRLASWGY